MTASRLRVFRWRAASPAPRLPRPALWRCLFITGLGVAALLIANGRAEATAYRHRWTDLPIWIGPGTTSPPPPAPLLPYLPRFQALLSSYIASGASGDISFAEWIARLGIVDAETHRAMLMLYWWWLRTG